MLGVWTCVTACFFLLHQPLTLQLLRCGSVLLAARLDNDVGTGVHLTPTGIEFDERRLTLGNSTEVSATTVTAACCLDACNVLMHCGGLKKENRRLGRVWLVAWLVVC